MHLWNCNFYLSYMSNVSKFTVRKLWKLISWGVYVENVRVPNSRKNCTTLDKVYPFIQRTCATPDFTWNQFWSFSPKFSTKLVHTYLLSLFVKLHSVYCLVFMVLDVSSKTWKWAHFIFSFVRDLLRLLTNPCHQPHSVKLLEFFCFSNFTWNQFCKKIC